eukprot:1373089-Rhodomonas_salina.1
MPAPRQMRYAADDGGSSTTVDERVGIVCVDAIVLPRAVGKTQFLDVLSRTTANCRRTAHPCRGIEEVKALVVQLRGGTDEEKGMAALGVYNMTSFASAVSIDDPKALTSYDKKVFGHEAEGASEDGEWKAGEPVPDSETPPESKSGDDELGEVRLRNHVWQ